MVIVYNKNLLNKDIGAHICDLVIENIGKICG